MFRKEILAKRIMELRKKAGYNQSQVAEQLNITQAAISKIEKGERAASIEVLYSLSDLFNVPLDYLVGQGLFSKWDQINQNWVAIMDCIEGLDPVLDQIISRLGDDHIHIVEVLSVMIDDIKITGEAPNAIIEIKMK